MPDSIIIIPARIGSTRFPSKPLAKISGTCMLERVWKIAKLVKLQADILIATDSEEIASFSKSIGAEVMLTSPGCKTGLDRAAEIISNSAKSYQAVATLQGDAVLTPPWVVEQAIAESLADKSAQIVTPFICLRGSALTDFTELKKSGSSTGTTVVFDKCFNALYFSKQIIPAYRDKSKCEELYRHIGLYVYKPEVLLELSKLPQSKLELAENLEQLRALENGYRIKMVQADYGGRTHASVDNPEDIAITEAIIKREGELF